MPDHPNLPEPLRPIIAFLLGEGTLHGYRFGELPADGSGATWWRKHLREALAKCEADESAWIVQKEVK